METIQYPNGISLEYLNRTNTNSISLSQCHKPVTLKNHMTEVITMLTEILITLQIKLQKCNNQIDLENNCEVSMMKFLLNQ